MSTYDAIEFAELFNCKSFQSIWKDLHLKIDEFKGNIINQKISQKNKFIENIVNIIILVNIRHKLITIEPLYFCLHLILTVCMTHCYC